MEYNGSPPQNRGSEAATGREERQKEMAEQYESKKVREKK
jgi:hypothetical protein